MRIAVAVPARDEVQTRFAFDLANMIAAHVMKTQDAIIPLVSEGTILSAQRMELVEEAKKENATHILFIDSDMRFPVDTLHRLLSHGEKVVAANCARRRMPTGPTAAIYDANGRKQRVYSMPDDTGLERVGSVGTGLMLVEMGVFEAMPLPWFATPWVSDSRCYMGEDVFFCVRLEKMGIPVYIDHDLSKEVGHIGTFEFKHKHTWAVKELDEAAAKEAEQPLVVM